MSKGAIMSVLRKFGRNTSGNMGVTFIIMTTALTGAVALGVETSRVVSNQAVMQDVTDSAALYGASMLADAALSDADLTTRVKGWVVAQVIGKGDLALDGNAVGVVIDRDAATIRVTASAGFDAIIPILTVDGTQSASASSTAGAATTAAGGGPGICGLALSSDAGKAMSFKGDGVMQSGSCVFWSNSRAKNATEGLGEGVAEVTRACSVGKYAKLGNYKILPPAEDNCTPLADPLAGWKPPVTDWSRCDFGGADPAKFDGGGFDVTLYPGNYCGGLDVPNARNVTLMPGKYFINGHVTIDAKGLIGGNGVYLHFTSAAENIDIKRSRIVLTAMADKALEGIVAYKQPSAKIGNKIQIEARDGFQTSGTWYFPGDEIEFRIAIEASQKQPEISVIAQMVAFDVEKGSVLSLKPARSLPDDIAPTVARKAVQLIN